VYLKYCYKGTFTVYRKRRRAIFAHYFIQSRVERLSQRTRQAQPTSQLSVFKATGPASEGEPSVLDPLQDRVEFGIAYVKRIMLAVIVPFASLKSSVSVSLTRTGAK
jgi:hypothetical protein